MPFVVIGGDHSCAMGTWGGVLNATHKPEEFGLIWIDAHMDAHTFATSPSGNIHGMPIAALLGQGGPSLARLCPARGKLSAENLKMMCMRSFEPEEVELLRSLNVTVYSDYELQQCENFPAFFRSVVDRAAQRWERFGISIDLDGVDPNDAPAVGSPEPGGIPAKTLCAALRTVQNHQKLVGIEIAEFEPTQDQNHKTRSLISDIIASVYGRY
jgi:arginase